MNDYTPASEIHSLEHHGLMRDCVDKRCRIYIRTVFPEAQAAPPDALREAAIDVLHAWDAGDIDRDFDRIMSAFDSLRAALAAPAGSVGHDDPGIVTANSDGTASVRPSVPAGSGHCIHGVNPDRDCARCGEGQS